MLDGQHHKYFDLLENYFKKASEMSAGPEEILDLAEKFNFLRQYAGEHFETEESIMENANYPDYERHHDEHLHFLEHVNELYESMKTKGSAPNLHVRSTTTQLSGLLNTSALQI